MASEYQPSIMRYGCILTGAGHGHGKTQYGNGQDDSPPEEKKPIIDQVTDLGADAAGTLAETAVKAGAKKAREAIAKRLSRPVAFLSRLLEAGVDVRFDADAGGWSRSDLVEWG